MANKSLSKGLDVIFGKNLSSTINEIQNNQNNNKIYNIEVDKIIPNPYQPRKIFNSIALAELTQSILQHGVFTPIIVRKSVRGFQLIAGERRLRASKAAKLKTIPAVIVDFDDIQMSEIALLENLQRENLNVIEEALAYKTLMRNNNWSQEELATKVSKSRPHIANKIRLLLLPQFVIEAVLENKLTMGQVRPLLGLKNQKIIVQLAKEIMSQKLSARRVEEVVRTYLLNANKSNSQKQKSNSYKYVESLIREKVLSKVKVDNNRIVIHFKNDSHLNDILEKLKLIK